MSHNPEGRLGFDGQFFHEASYGCHQKTAEVETLGISSQTTIASLIYASAGTA